jgi:hypothetical protein
VKSSEARSVERIRVVDSSGHVDEGSAPLLVWSSEEAGCSVAGNPEVSKARVNPDCPFDGDTWCQIL